MMFCLTTLIFFLGCYVCVYLVKLGLGGTDYLRFSEIKMT